jgi:hypothetical protein
MTDDDLVEEFFDELNRRGHDPLLDRLEGTGRFEVVETGRTDYWMVTVKGGYVAVSPGNADADWVMRADRAVFNDVIRGTVGSLAAHLGGMLNIVLQDTSMRFGLIARLFAGPPQTRGQRTSDDCRLGQARS